MRFRPDAEARAPGPVARLRPPWPLVALGLLIYLPLLRTRPGRIGADTKTYLTLDVDRLLERAPTMWDQHVGLGTVTHQNIGYLWPMGPYYWAAHALRVPEWVAQRLWLGTILFGAGAGVWFLMRKVLELDPWAATVASYIYAFTPFTLSLAARLSGLLLPYAALPWMIALAVLAVRRGGWRYPAMFALVVATVGSVNATALVLAGLGPVLWFPYAVWGSREATFRQASGAFLRIGVLTLATNLWWMAGLLTQGGYGIDILHYTETAKTVASGSVSAEVLRGLGYWFFYGSDRLGLWIEPGSDYTQKLWLIVVTFAIPVVGLLAATMVRWRHRAYFVTLVAVGTLLGVGAYPWDHPTLLGKVWKVVVGEKVLAMRSTPRAVPLLVLGLAVMTGCGVAALARRSRRWAPPLTIGLAALAAAGLPPLFTGDMVATNLDRPTDIPSYWTETAAYLDAGGSATRVLEVPGIDFAAYRWGNTVDPVLPGLMERPEVARELIPYGTPPSADLLIALDRRLQENIADPEGLAAAARLLGAGEVLLRSDIQYERYHSARPYVVARLLDQAAGLGRPVDFGPPAPDTPLAALPLIDALDLQADDGGARAPVQVYPVSDAQPLVRVLDGSRPVVVSGSGEGVVDLAEAGLIDGTELLLYSGSYAGDPARLQADAGPGAVLVVTDTNRRRAEQWSLIHENNGFTEQAGETGLVDDPSDNRLPVFEGGGDTDDSKSVAVYPGGVSARATSYGNPGSYTPEFRPAQAVDGDPRTAWVIGTGDVRGERIELQFDPPVSTDHVQLSQLAPPGANRQLTEVEVRFDGRQPTRLTLGADSVSGAGQRFDFDDRTFSTLSIEAVDDSSGRQSSLLRPNRFQGLSPVGFSEISVGGRTGQEAVRLPADLLAADPGTGKPLTLVLSRLRSDATNVVRADEEAAIARTWTQPEDRSFALGGTVRLSARVGDQVLDDLLGTSGGVTAGSSRRLAGAVDARASAAIDGDPGTAWTPELGAGDNTLSYHVAQPLTVTHLDLVLEAGSRRSLPASVVVAAAGRAPVKVPLGALPAADAQGHVTVPVVLPEPVTGTDISVSFPDVTPSVTTEWFSNAPIQLPVTVAELGVEGLRSPPPPPRFDTGCRDDLVDVDGRPVSIQVSGPTAAAQSRAALDVALCGPDAAGIDLDAGDHVLRAAKGLDTGLDLDRLVLQSDRDGSAPAAVGPLAPSTDSVPVTIDGEGRISYDLLVGPTDEVERPWLVLGQSHSAGWEASVRGETLDGSTLVNGYANGWRLPEDAGPFAVALRWTPQSTVTRAIVLSLLAVLACIVILTRGVVMRRLRRARGQEPVGAVSAREPRHGAARHVAPGTARLPADPRLAPWPADGPDGPGPGALRSGMYALVSGLVVVAVAGLVAGVVTAAAVLVGCRRRRARPLLALGAPFWLALGAAWVLLRQWHTKPTAAIEWPGELRIVHPVGWLAVAFLVATLVVDRAWARTDDDGPTRPDPGVTTAGEDQPDPAPAGDPEPAVAEGVR